MFARYVTGIEVLREAHLVFSNTFDKKLVVLFWIVRLPRLYVILLLKTTERTNEIFDYLLHQ